MCLDNYSILTQALNVEYGVHFDFRYHWQNERDENAAKSSPDLSFLSKHSLLSIKYRKSTQRHQKHPLTISTLVDTLLQ